MTQAKGRGDLCMAIVSAVPERMASFRAALETRGFRVDAFRDAWSLLQAARATGWNLVVLDSQTLPVRETLERLMEINACQHVAVLTNQAPEAFHEETEGLGVLAPIPVCPETQDLDSLLERLRSVGGLDPTLEAAQRAGD